MAIIFGLILAAALLDAPAALAQQPAPGAATPLPVPPGLAPDVIARLVRHDELNVAIARGDAARVATWIKTHRELDFNFDEAYPGRTSQSPLTLAISRDRLEIARMLIDAGADIRRQDGFGRAAIHYARSAQAVQLLSQRGADVDAPDSSGRSVLVSAVERGDLPAIDRIIAGGARLEASARGADLLAIAVERKRAELVGPLLDRGVDPRKPPTRALWLLIDRGDDANALMLIRRGADVNHGDGRGQTLLTRALFRKRWEVAEALAEGGASLKPPDVPGCSHSCPSIQPARLASFNPPTLGRLKAKGLDLNTVAADGHTALTSIIADTPMAIRAVRATGTAVGVARSAATGETAVITAPRSEQVTEIPAPDNAARLQALLDARADPNVKYRDATPLMLAIVLPNKPPAMADALLEAGGTIEIEAIFVRHDPKDGPRPSGSGDLAPRVVPTADIVLIGMSIGPLTWAVLHGRPDIATRLLERERKLSRADRHLLYFAAAGGHWDLVTSALRHARDVDASDRADVTPLMFAAQAGNAKAVRALLAAGADVNARSVRSWPPLSEFNLGSAIAGHSPSPPRLAGGYTALRAARERGHAEVVRLLQEAGGRD
jgi:ankyrin repeat protein